MRTKYNNRRPIIDGIQFDSMKEANHYGDLLLLERTGQIKALELHPSFVLQVPFTDGMGTKHRALTYRADFKYYDKKLRRWVVEDVKGFKTEVYRIKIKLFLYGHQDLIFKEV